MPSLIYYYILMIVKTYIPNIIDLIKDMDDATIEKEFIAFKNNYKSNDLEQLTLSDHEAFLAITLDTVKTFIIANKSLFLQIDNDCNALSPETIKQELAMSTLQAFSEALGQSKVMDLITSRLHGLYLESTKKP